MDDISNSAVIDSLLASIASLLPNESNPIFQSIVGINAARITAPGVGAFVGNGASVTDEIFGRHLEGDMVVSVKRGTIGDLNNAINATTRALLGVDRKELLGHGILKLNLHEVISQVFNESESDSNQVFRKDLIFKILYEFLKTPEESEGIIQEIPINQSVG